MPESNAFSIEIAAPEMPSFSIVKRVKLVASMGCTLQLKHFKNREHQIFYSAVLCFICLWRDLI
jgi:hypothetical protein